MPLFLECLLLTWHRCSFPSPPPPLLGLPRAGEQAVEAVLGWGEDRAGRARGGLVTPVVACPPLPVSAKPADAGRGSGDKLSRYTRALQRSPFPIQPASLHPSNIKGFQVPLLPFLPPGPSVKFSAPLLLRIGNSLQAAGNTQKR